MNTYVRIYITCTHPPSFNKRSVAVAVFEYELGDIFDGRMPSVVVLLVIFIWVSGGTM